MYRKTEVIGLEKLLHSKKARAHWESQKTAQLEMKRQSLKEMCLVKCQITKYRNSRCSWELIQT